MMGGQKMNNDRYKKQELLAKLTAEYAVSKIVPLQEAYLGSNGGRSAWARATLAKLGRLNNSVSISWLSAGEQLFDRWPSEKLVELGGTYEDEERMLRTLEAVLSLYAIHQQSSRTRCAFVCQKDESDADCKKSRRQASFACCCRRIKPDLDAASGVRRRLVAIETATDFAGVLYGVRGLIRLIKSADAAGSYGLDYYALARDLYLLQGSSQARDRVFARWSKDYFATLA